MDRRSIPPHRPRMMPQRALRRRWPQRGAEVAKRKRGGGWFDSAGRLLGSSREYPASWRPLEGTMPMRQAPALTFFCDFLRLFAAYSVAGRRRDRSPEADASRNRAAGCPLRSAARRPPRRGRWFPSMRPERDPPERCRNRASGSARHHARTAAQSGDGSAIDSRSGDPAFPALVADEEVLDQGDDDRDNQNRCSVEGRSKATASCTTGDPRW